MGLLHDQAECLGDHRYRRNLVEQARLGGLGLKPAGDAQRVWFPEMIEELKRSWSKAMDWKELADLCEHMTQKRKQIRQERGIQPPKTRCTKCGLDPYGRKTERYEKRVPGWPQVGLGES